VDKIVFLPSAILGALLVASYLVLGFRRKTPIELKNMVSLFLSGAGFVGGILLLCGCFSEEARKKVDDLPLYIFIAGMAVLYVSFQAAHRDFTDKK